MLLISSSSCICNEPVPKFIPKGGNVFSAEQKPYLSKDIGCLDKKLNPSKAGEVMAKFVSGENRSSGSSFFPYQVAGWDLGWQEWIQRWGGGEVDTSTF